MNNDVTNLPPVEEQQIFFDKLALAYRLTVEKFACDLEKIAEMDPNERIEGLRTFHESFGKNAVNFVSDTLDLTLEFLNKPRNQSCDLRQLAINAPFSQTITPSATTAA
jgi:hypothetical protein